MVLAMARLQALIAKIKIDWKIVAFLCALPLVGIVATKERGDPFPFLELIIFYVICFPVIGYFLVRNGKWHETADGRQMRRFVGGQWQYRPMTPEERADALEHERLMDDDARQW